MGALLAGASGVIGRVLLRLLTDQGHQVIALSRHRAGALTPRRLPAWVLHWRHRTAR
jgi:nucleoside-diphosphate-sugar epimerase